MEGLVIGFDLGKDYSQICCWNEKTEEPVSVSVVAGAEKYRIPTESLEIFLKKSHASSEALRKASRSCRLSCFP